MTVTNAPRIDTSDALRAALIGANSYRPLALALAAARACSEHPADYVPINPLWQCTECQPFWVQHEGLYGPVLRRFAKREDAAAYAEAIPQGSLIRCHIPAAS